MHRESTCQLRTVISITENTTKIFFLYILPSPAYNPIRVYRSRSPWSDLTLGYYLKIRNLREGWTRKRVFALVHSTILSRRCFPLSQTERKSPQLESKFHGGARAQKKTAQNGNNWVEWLRGADTYPAMGKPRKIASYDCRPAKKFAAMLELRWVPRGKRTNEGGKKGRSRKKKGAGKRLLASLAATLIPRERARPQTRADTLRWWLLPSICYRPILEDNLDFSRGRKTRRRVGSIENW